MLITAVLNQLTEQKNRWSGNDHLLVVKRVLTFMRIRNKWLLISNQIYQDSSLWSRLLQNHV